MSKEKLIGNIILMLTSIIWGSAFVAQRVGMDYIGPHTFNAARFILAALVLIPVIHILEKKIRKKLELAAGKEQKKIPFSG